MMEGNIENGSNKLVKKTEPNVDISISCPMFAYAPDTGPTDTHSGRTVYRFKKGHYVHVNYAISCDLHGRDISVEEWGRSYLLDSNGYQEWMEEWSFTMPTGEMMPTLDVCFKYPINAPGVYNIHTKGYNYNCESEDKLTFIELPESYAECFSFSALDLKRGSIDDIPEFKDDKRSQKAFNIKDLEVIGIFLTLKNLQAEPFVAEFMIRVYNPKGRCVRYDVRCADWVKLDGGGYAVQLESSLTEYDVIFWDEGRYVVKICFMGETIVSVPFDIGSKDVFGDYKEPILLTDTPDSNKPNSNNGKNSPFMQELQKMIGLGEVKEKIENYKSLVSLANKRKAAGLPYKQPSLHSAFLGPSGTGKTTVANIFGMLLKEVGMLSKGHVVRVERKDLFGKYYGDEAKNINKYLKQAQGGILFIDEAYTLYKEDDPKDPGMQVLEALLTALADESNRDWMLLLAGYTGPMLNMLEQNTGFNSRIPEQNRYYFSDYNVDELLQIADLYCEKHEYIITKGARKALKSRIKKDYDKRDGSFGNGRYIENLFSLSIVPSMSVRVDKIDNPSGIELQTIEKEDIVNSAGSARILSFDEKAINRALKKLNSLVGLEHVKESLNNFVKIVRYLNKEGRLYDSIDSLHWNFIGNSGTGKSTVAAILGDLLRAMGLIDSGHLVELKGETLYQVADYKIDEVLKRVLQKSQKGLLFVDGDAPLFKRHDSNFNSGMLRIKLVALMAEQLEPCALVVASLQTNSNDLASSLYEKGVYGFDRTLYFTDYSAEQLLEILKMCLKKRRLVMDEAAEKVLGTFIKCLCNNSSLGYANARVMKLISRSIEDRYIIRVTQDKSAAAKVVTVEDVAGFVWDKSRKGKIGF